MKLRPTVTITIVYTREVDGFIAGMTGDNYERTSYRPRRFKQTRVEWRDVPSGVYTVYVIAIERGEQVAVASTKACYGMFDMEACAPSSG